MEAVGEKAPLPGKSARTSTWKNAHTQWCPASEKATLPIMRGEAFQRQNRAAAHHLASLLSVEIDAPQAPGLDHHECVKLRQPTPHRPGGNALIRT